MKKIFISSTLALCLGLVSVANVFAVDPITQITDPVNQTPVPESVSDTQIPSIAGKKPVLVMPALTCPQPKVLYCTRINGYIFCYCF